MCRFALSLRVSQKAAEIREFEAENLLDFRGKFFILDELKQSISGRTPDSCLFLFVTII